jgi:hypothetical protein
MPPGTLDSIFRAMKGRRVFQPMGFKVCVTPAADDNGEVGLVGDTHSPKRPGERVIWDWMQSLHDWIDLSSGDVLTGHEPTDALARVRDAALARPWRCRRA